jgi:hypothetical protein
VLLLVAAVALPQLSVSYGLLRLYEQEAALLAPLVALSFAAVAIRLLGRRLGTAVTCGAVLAAFAVLTGLVPQALGGYSAQMILNNSGSYYQAYYVGPGQLAAVQWMRAHVKTRTTVVSDEAGSGTLREQTNIAPMEGLLPRQVPADAVALVRTAGHNRVHAAGIYGDAIVSYTFPTSCLGHRPVLFRSGREEVLGRATGPAS